MVHRTNAGPRPILEEVEEKALADHLVQTVPLGYGKTKKQVLNFVENVAREKGVLKLTVRDCPVNGLGDSHSGIQSCLFSMEMKQPIFICMNATNEVLLQPP